MQCPTDKVDLVMTERQGIEIDYCPKCRGVWLDRGELDKIIERSAAAPAPAAAAAAPPPQPYQRPEYERSERRDYDDRHHGRPYRKKREGFLGELFDFD